MNTYIFYAPEAIAVPLIIVLIGTFFHNWWVIVLGVVSLVCMLFFYRAGDTSAFKRLYLDQGPPVASEPVSFWASGIIGSGDRGLPVGCPCDARVLEIERVHGSLHIAFFLNIHNVHVQYVPLDGVITSISHKLGTFAPAYFFEKSQYNERVVTTFDTVIGPVIIAQIAGQVARRIVSFHSTGAVLRQGDPLGLIKFGSRVDIWLPAHRVIDVAVKKNDRVRIGGLVCVVR